MTLGLTPPPPSLLVGRDEALDELKARLGMPGQPRVRTDSAKLLALRERKVWTQEELAEKSGISVRTIQKIESGKTLNSNPTTISALAEALGVEPQELRPERSGEGPPPEGLVQVLSAVRGWPGVGKTTLAAALANDRQVSAAFPDGVLWAHLGTSPDLPPKLYAWGRAVGLADLALEKSLDDVHRRLAAHLREKRMVLIVDDAWEPEHARALLVGGRKCAALVLTRNTRVAEALALPDSVYRLECLDEDSSVELLRQLAPQVVADFPRESRQLARDLEGLPLSLQVAGRLLRVESGRGWSVGDLLTELRAGTALLEQRAPPGMADVMSETTPTVLALLKKSTDTLCQVDRDRFALLGVVREQPATFDVDFLRAQWQTSDPKSTVDALVDRGLLEPAGDGQFQMHALLVAFARSMLE